jgi:hypothetical protein
MARRAAKFLQTEVVRTIKAAREAGLTIVRLKVTADGVALETDAAPSPAAAKPPAGDEKSIVL